MTRIHGKIVIVGLKGEELSECMFSISKDVVDSPQLKSSVLEDAFRIAFDNSKK